MNTIEIGAGKRTKCPICECKENMELFKQKFANINGVTFIHGYEVVSCNKCGFTYANNIPKQEDLDRYFKWADKTATYAYNLEQQQQREYKKTWDFLEANAPIIKKIGWDISLVDVGCASGNFLFWLKQNGVHRLLGVTPSQSCVDFMINRRGLNAKNGTINQVDLKEKYDVVKLTMVLEHVEDLKNTILKLKNMMKKDGVLFITVPNVTQFHRSVQQPFREFSVEHINYFSHKSLDNLMNSCGLRRVACNDRIEPELGIEVIYEQANCLDFPLDVDAESKYLLQEYIETCNIEADRKDRTIEPFVSNQEPIVVWGCGSFTQRQLVCGNLGKCNIQAIVDSNWIYQGGTYNGIEVIAPEQLLNYKGDVVISTYCNNSQILNYIQNGLKIGNRHCICL